MGHRPWSWRMKPEQESALVLPEPAHAPGSCTGPAGLPKGRC